MSESKKEVKEWLKLLPLQKRLQAIENIRRDNLQMSSILNGWCSKNDVLSGTFLWSETRQGFTYWDELDTKHYP